MNTFSLIKKTVIWPGKANKLTRRNILLTQRHTCKYKNYT